jgi:hypothetical protein
MPWWIRAYLGFAAFQGFGIGLTGLLLPGEMQIPLRISPLNARVAAALYVAGGIGVLWAAFARRREETRLFIIGFGTATALILILTVLHWSDFMADGLPHRPVWIFVYVADPLLALAIVPAAGLWPSRHGRQHRLTPLLGLEAVLFAVLALALLGAPASMAAGWPWTLPPLLGQLYGCFLLTFAIGAALAMRETEVGAIRAFALSSLALLGLVLIASLLHLDRFKTEPVTWVWFGSLAFGVLAFGLALLAERSSGWLPQPSIGQSSNP